MHPATTKLARTIELTIHGVTFEAPQPFTAGHPCSEGEASVLNAQFAENLRNNFAKRVKAAQDGVVTEQILAVLQQDFANYATNYSLSPRTSSDPIERAAVRIAADLVREALNKKGLKPSDLAEGVFDEHVRAVASREAVRSEAARRVAATKSIVAATLDLDGLA